MTSRRLRVLLQRLPPESHTMTALRNELTDEELADQADTGQPEKGRWSQADQLFASVYDVLRRIEHVLICTNVEKNQRPEPPQPMRRPGATPKKSTPTLDETGADRLFAMLHGGPVV